MKNFNLKKSLAITFIILLITAFATVQVAYFNYINTPVVISEDDDYVPTTSRYQTTAADVFALDSYFDDWKFGSMKWNWNEINNVEVYYGEEAEEHSAECAAEHEAYLTELEAEKAAAEAAAKAAEEEAARQAAAKEAAQQTASVGTFRDGMYARFVVPSVGINVGVYWGNAQSTVDASDAAGYFAYNDTYLLGDHCHQGFSSLYSVGAGTTAYFAFPDGSVQNYVCVGALWGHNTGYDLTDGNFVPVSNPGGFCAYTCASYTDSYNDYITYWQPC